MPEVVPAPAENEDGRSKDCVGKEGFGLLVGAIEDAVNIASRSHYAMARRWRRVDLGISIPLAIFAAGTAGGTSAFALSAPSSGSPFAWVAVGAALVSSALAALNTSQQPGKKAESHESTGKRYSALKYRCRYVLILEEESDQRRAEILQALI
ncbi:SLATT domain-containing protein [Corallococcus sp. M34]|uniref:SLATT domain-containing protein n=1 Tax=Citreicoccus inhibens TaxID=2849499 RepID=UPI001C22F7C3|nr:SLATT domain-containing protein [Citreicoccus inhibens]MBU8900646.1 SLATT domain-containing protein [Citreicoccus inhibens]